MTREARVSNIIGALFEGKENKIPAQVRKKANAYLADFCSSYREPKEVAKLWDTLDKYYDIEVGMITGIPDKSASGSKSWTTSYKYMGNEVENSMLVYQVYEPNSVSNKAEYNIYLS